MPAREFGFICRHFSVEVSANGFVLPGAEGAYLGSSLVPVAELAEVSGRYLLRLYCRGSMVCNGKVELAWGPQAAQSEPVLAIKPEDAQKVTEAMRKVSGQDVELRLTPIPAR